MADSTRKRLADRLRSAEYRESYLALLACLALVVVAGVVTVITQRAQAKNHTETVLDCPYTGNGAHTHNADCYDKSGTLVCPLEERELHTHDDSCYTEEWTLVCGLEEGEELEDGTIHTHTDDCYEVERVLTCGLEEITEEHVHGPGCFRTIEVDDEEDEEGEDDMPAQTFEEELEDEDGNVFVRVTVDAPAGAFPANTTMEIELIESDDARTVAEEAAQDHTNGKVDQIQLVDITFYDESGEEIEPAKPVTVKFASDLIAQSENPMVVHIEDDGTGSIVETLDEKELERRNESAEDDELVFDTTGSEFGVETVRGE